MREICAEWLDVDPSSLSPDVSFGLSEWGIDDYGGYDRLHRFAVTQRDLFSRMKPIPGAAKTLRRLSGMGVYIRIITHRLFLKYSHKATVTQTVDWLDHYDVPYWDICFMGDKPAVGAHLYIDDTPSNVDALRKAGSRVIVFSNSTNRDVAGPRADNWDDVWRLVMEEFREWKTGTHTIFEGKMV
jgi:5'(3')-deoxyribonucleotidase